MPTSIKTGEKVYAPILYIDKRVQAPFDIVQGNVKERHKRSAYVDLPYGLGNHKIATSKLYKNVGILILKIGDFQTETSLLNPLSRSLLNYCKLLIPDDQLKICDLRTREEFEYFVEQYHAAYSHIVLVGHGDGKNLIFANSHKTSVQTIIRFMEAQKLGPKTFISLSCHTGEAGFGKPLSQSKVCSALLAPLGAVHGGSASQFVQTYFGFHFLDGQSTKVAFRNARIQAPGAACFRCWENGSFEGAK